MKNGILKLLKFSLPIPCRNPSFFARCRKFFTGSILLLMFLLPAVHDFADDRIKEFQKEIKKLSENLEVIKRNERGVLDELWSLESERKLIELEMKAISYRIEQISKDIHHSRGRIAQIHRDIELTTLELSQSIRNLYKLGKLRHYRLILTAENQPETIQFFKYATYFAKKNVKLIANFEKQLEEIETMGKRLAQEESDLQETKLLLAHKKKMLTKSETRWRSLLKSIREEKQIHHQAKEELLNACQELEKLVDSFGELKEEQVFPVLNASKFKRFFYWPAEGDISARFGVRKHPRFKTAIPHNGIDISAELGADIRATFDGKVVFSEWFKGYGLTVIIDHGHDIYSIYAHASAILVEAGEWVKKGALIGKVGDSGSLKGPYLYFEIREKGKPIDPIKWLAKR